ncbi:T9SS type A sorting domain-containing protein [Epilithonimonas ginsengisoli]|uniref:T9SS type A sorting domain-containing protein n=1 Tax=Epilithonimonas ginsengisoli TaxID=1245592 RepID=A0ABU4JDR5_9FLAO|nr:MULTISPECIES: T9SS type A sorting domain-containing protein [Chryseobacterium group]MBV6878961.1 T9SS type A sorting domain-containing protein [Epilithonimonas sp. FP105]MDW8547808.1 T9SS type A sorting domain-containing protein [Epilithonimonas ginsengisoli]OAH76029.1 hypothetical protein AXA65_01895 [Chryseobacterium sp. FP211-J200]
MKTIFTTLILCVLSTICYAQDKMFRHKVKSNGQTYTMLDHPLLNNKPDARPIVSKFGGNTGVFSTQIVGVFYNETNKKWGIYNENLLPMTVDHEFTVYVPSPEFSLTQVAADDYYTTEINHPLLNGKPDTFAVMTHVVGGVYNNQPVAFWYDDITTDGKWNIYDEDGDGAIPGGTKFFVAVEGEQGIVKHRHIVTNQNEGYSTSVYHPLMANANARFVWAHNTGRQGENSATELKSSMLAYFSNPFWRIGMEDLSDIPTGTVLDFLIYDPNAMSTEDLSGANQIQVFPNPIIDNVNFKSKNTILEVSIYDMTGKKVLSSEKQSSSSVQMSATSLPAGVYTARIKTNKGFESLKLIKK